MRVVLGFLVLCTAQFMAVYAGRNLSFSFPSFNASIDADIKIFHDTYLEPRGGYDVIQLTTESDGKTYSGGWAVYARSMPVWNRSSQALANFSTHFQFVIEKGPASNFNPGDGMAFFMAPIGYEVPFLSQGKWLSLFNTTTVGNPGNHVVAVEFDTDKDSHDPDDNHVGIDVNTVISAANETVRNGSLKDGKKWDAWVDYDGGGKKIELFLSRDGSKPAVAILGYDIDLSEFLPENVIVGFSAATGQGSESHTLLSWELSCTTSWDASFLSIQTKQNKTLGKKSHKTVIVICTVAAVAAVFGVVLSGGYWYLYIKPRGWSREAESEMALDAEVSQGPRKFTYAELNAATNNFSDSEKLGQGGFGSVYRGILQDTNELVAVKRVSQGSKQGKKEYVAEVNIISRLGHRNLVQLLGWCHEKGELLLVYEYLSNGSLDKMIFGDAGSLDWARRYSIACGVASALVYLHEDYDQCILHRDVKSSNVMLDSNYNARLGDFGLARLVQRDTTSAHTTVVAGTLGYLAPECILSGKATTESDVFSFGAVALEIACGRRALDERLREKYNARVVQWVWDLYGQGKVLETAAESLKGNFNREEMERLLVVGLWCSNPDPSARPSMRQVLKVLRFEAPLPGIPAKMPVTVYMYTDPLRPSDVLSTTTLYGTCQHEEYKTTTTSVAPR